MVSAILLGTVLLAAGPARETLAPPDLEAYEAARAGAGRDADDQVRLALWCEAHGLQAERVKHLALAVMVDPKNALARGLLGLVRYRGRWQRPEVVGEQAAADARLAEYRDRRARTPDDADAQWELALWCEENGLKAEASAHLTKVTKLDPGREAAWKRLGYKQHERRWVTAAELSDEKAEAGRQKQADRRWKPLLENWRAALAASKARRNAADLALSQITDPRAVPMVWAVFATGGAEHQAVAVRVLGQIDAAEASRALAMLATSSRSAEVRRTATETLRRRDPREFADLLIALLRDPIKYTVRPVGGPGSPGELHVEGKTADLTRRYSPPTAPNVPILPGDRIGYDSNGLPIIDRLEGGPRFKSARASQLVGYLDQPGFEPIALSFLQKPPAASTGFLMRYQPVLEIPIGRMQLEAQRSAAVAQQQLACDAEPLRQYNAMIQPGNDRALAVLSEVTGQDLGADRDAWTRWWTDQLGYNAVLAQKASAEKPTIVEDVPLNYQPQSMPVNLVQVTGFARISCFGAGTPVHTLAGLRPIESLSIGDQVLTQDLHTGALGYRPILVVHRNPPSKTFRIQLADETIVSSYFHRFWKAGHGWVMARDLKAGDTLRTLGGLVQVGTIDEGSVQPVFNLDVADDADFFVGTQGALVHDNTLPDLRLPPFDTLPTLTATP